MTQLSELNNVSIAVICFYVPALVVATYLSAVHSWGRMTSWFYMGIFSIARIMGSAFDLASINDPTNTSLAVGFNTLLNIGLSPLILVILGLLDHVLDTIRRRRNTFVTKQHTLMIHILIFLGLVLAIVGGIALGSNIGKEVTQAEKTGQALPAAYTVPIESVVGMVITIIVFALLMFVTAATALDVSAAAPAERRLLLAVAVALPFLFIRLLFSAISTLSQNPHFRMFFGAPDFASYLLGMAIVMEMICMIIFQSASLTLPKPRDMRKELAGDDFIPLR